MKNSSEESSDLFIKLRRLKIEESVITKSIKSFLDSEDKCVSEDVIGDQHVSLGIRSGRKYDISDYVAPTKRSLQEIRSLHDDIKTYVAAEDNMEYLEVDDVRKEILDLEAKLQTLKNNTSTQLTILKQEEIELMEQKNEVVVEKNVTQQPQVKNKLNINAAVLSPVRSLINSPLKCDEVQRFQEFIRSSKNAYGGWSPYCHNIFVQIWQKYFILHDESEVGIENYISFDAFLAELIRKIPDLKKQDAITHGNWYRQYLRLKNNQQNAIDQWKTNRKLKEMISRSNQNKTDHCDQSGEDVYKTKISKTGGVPKREIKSNGQKIADSKSFKLAVDYKSGYNKSTKQWDSKCNTAEDTVIHPFNLEHIEKLCTPSWRKNLQC